MMDRGSAERAFGWHMQAANMAPHPDAAVGEWSTPSTWQSAST